MTMSGQIKAIAFHIPEQIVTNEELARRSENWTAEKIEQKTGIFQRGRVAKDECASDLAVLAAEKLFSSGSCKPADVDFVLLCTQSPDYLLPTTACLVQERLGLRQTVGALDFNLGCSGYVYGLGLAEGLIASGQARNLLFLTADTYTKYLSEEDLSVRTLFGDAGAATWIQAEASPEKSSLGPFLYGTDGRGAENLIVPESAMRGSRQISDKPSGCLRLQMNGAEIFSFTLKAVPKLVHETLNKAHCTLEEIDLFVFHQANQYMLEHLRKKINIPSEKFYLCLRNYGNTVSSSIPIALANAEAEGVLKCGMRVMLVGFGVGYSWGATLLRWHS